MGNVVPMIYNASVSIISWVVNILLAFVISCYIMTDKKTLINGFKKIIYSFVPQDFAHKIIVTTKECNQIFSRYIIGKALDSLIIGIICFIFMTIVNLPYSILISLVVGITNMIPYFGPFIGAIPGILLLLIISPNPPSFLRSGYSYCNSLTVRSWVPRFLATPPVSSRFGLFSLLLWAAPSAEFSVCSLGFQLWPSLPTF